MRTMMNTFLLLLMLACLPLQSADENTTAPPFDPELDDPNWPGLVPYETNHTNSTTLVINVRYDDYPFEIEWRLERLLPRLGRRLRRVDTEAWVLVDEFLGHEAIGTKLSSVLVSYENEGLIAGSRYRFTIRDEADDGLCCDYGLGWVTITSQEGFLWSLPGDLIRNQTTAVYFTVDANGTIAKDNQEALDAFAGALPQAQGVSAIEFGDTQCAADGQYFSCTIPIRIIASTGGATFSNQVRCPLSATSGFDFQSSPSSCSCTVQAKIAANNNLEHCTCSICPPGSAVSTALDCSGPNAQEESPVPLFGGVCNSIGCNGQCAMAEQDEDSSSQKPTPPPTALQETTPPPTASSQTEEKDPSDQQADDGWSSMDCTIDGIWFTCIGTNTLTVGPNVTEITNTVTCDLEDLVGDDIAQAPPESCDCRADLTEQQQDHHVRQRTCGCTVCPEGSAQRFSLDCSMVTDDPFIGGPCSALDCDGRCASVGPATLPTTLDAGK